MPSAPDRRARTRRAHRIRTSAAMLVMLLSLVVLSGCTYVRVGLIVQADDTVGGEILVATPVKEPGDKGPQAIVPPQLSGDVTVAAYQKGEYVGFRLRFSRLSFQEVSLLTSVVSTVEQDTEFTLRRVGNRVVADGSADLTSATADREDIQLTISFPGTIVETDGDTETGSVTWDFEPGDKRKIHAVARVSDPDGPSTLVWSLLLTAIVAGAAVAVVHLARQDRNPPIDRSL